MNSLTPNSLSSEERGRLLDVSDSESDRDNALNLAAQNTSVPKLAGILSPLDSVRSAPWRVLTLRFSWFLVPSFLQGRSMREKIRPAKLGPTAYLDGMRGIAALFVYFCHYLYQCYRIGFSWGFEGNYNFMRFPFIRLYCAGPAAVCVFFVISGYALSYRPIKYIRSHNLADFSTGLSSMAFRRAIRLFLPTSISTFMVVCLVRMGVFEWTREFATQDTYLKESREPHPKLLPTAYEQWVQWGNIIFGGFKVFSWDFYEGFHALDPHLWTIPVEFRCSLYLFLTLLATARLQTKYRFLTLAVIAFFTYANSRWDFLLFLSGMALVEWDYIRGAHISGPALPFGEKEAKAPSPTASIKLIFWNLVAILGLYLLSSPDHGGLETPGWVYLWSLIPKWWATEQYRYWQATGSVVFVLAVGHLAWWQRVFNSRVAQYFGKISYSLYLMHGPMNKVIGYHWQKMVWDITGVEGNAYTVGFILGAFFCIPSVIWAADVFWRAVDIPTVKFARWFENKLIKVD
ncbi:hypothetical protein AUP68_05302 [Ilyonectria robusta]